ncbi:hypothetical protein J6590_032988 [Homalodisca vitripennis]|nr:hypothetical protein J6590_032988 [Homalodisca vitripennis]
MREADPLLSLILPSWAAGLCEDLIKQDKGEIRYSTRSMLMSRLRGDKAKRLEEERLAALAAVRDRSKSLCVTSLLRPGYDPATIAARDLNLHALQRRRASSAM